MLLLCLSAGAQVVAGGAIPQTNGQLFRPTIDGSHTLWADDTGKAPDGYFLARGLVHYTRDPVIWTNATDGEVTRLVGDLFQANLLAAYQRGPVRIGVDVPLYLRNVADTGGETGLGDVALDVKATALDRRDTPVGLALGGRIMLPTTTVEAPLGHRGFAWELSGIVDRELGDLLATANLGIRGVPREELQNFDWGTAAVARLGAGYAFTEKAGASLDLAGQLNLAELTGEATPLEVLLGGWYRVDDTVLRLGIGTGLTQGFGSPSLRTLLSVSYEPPRVRDTDGDGIFDRDDDCPADAEDADGFRDDDGCPEPTSVRIAIVDPDGAAIPGATYSLIGRSDRKEGAAGDELALPAGSYTLAVSAEGYKPGEPEEVEVPGGERATLTRTLELDIQPADLTVTVVDNDGNPIEGATWKVRGTEEGPQPTGATRAYQPGEYRVRVEAPGFRPKGIDVMLEDGTAKGVRVTLQPAKVELTKIRIDIKESVYFETGKAVIKPDSFALLDEVAQVITDHPELLKIRIEGHTDSRGSASSNLALSKERAAAVLDYLVAKGVEADRLEAEGFGEDKPLVQGNNEDAWSKNRRVDFFVAERSD